MRVTRKILTQAAANLFFKSIFQRYSLFFFGFFSFFLYYSLFVFFACFFFWNLKYIFWYTFDYAGGWVIKNFHPTDFRKQDYFSLAL